MASYRSARDWDLLVPQIMEDLKNGRRLKTVAKEAGVSQERLRQVLKAYGEKIPAQRPGPLGKRPSKAFLIQRGLDIVDERIKEGMSLEEIGAKHGITRERVRQILVEAGYESHTEQAKVGKEETEAHERERLHREAVNLLTENPGLTRLDLAQELGVPQEAISRLLGTSVWMLSEEQVTSVAYSDEEMLTAIRRAAAAHDSMTLSGRAYDAWRQTMKSNAPGSQTIIRRFGSWSNAIEEAGLEPIAARRSNYNRITWDEAVSAVSKFIVHERKASPYARATSADYEAFSQEFPGAPSIAGIRLYWSWRDVRVGAVRAILEKMTVAAERQASETENALEESVS